jgi:general secretion pathway protein D
LVRWHAIPLTRASGLNLGYFEGTVEFLGTEILNLGVLVQALASDANTNILATPNLVTLDNQEAEIVVAQNVPFVTGEFTSTGSGRGRDQPVPDHPTQDVGLTLKVTPQINEGNAIQLQIEQEISNVVARGTGSRRHRHQQALYQDQRAGRGPQMVVLGGLLDEDLTENVQKVPLLGDLPLLGNLFKSRSTNKVKRNLMVFLQPSIIRDAAYYSQTSQGKYNYIRARQMELRDTGVGLMPNSEAPVLPEYPEHGELIGDVRENPDAPVPDAMAPAETRPLVDSVETTPNP